MSSPKAAELEVSSAGMEELTGVNRTGQGFRSARILVHNLAVPERAKVGTVLWSQDYISSLPEDQGSVEGRKLLEAASRRHPGEFLTKINKLLVKIRVN